MASGESKHDVPSSYSMRLVRPYMKVLAGHEAFPPEAFEHLNALDPDDRIPADVLHSILDHAVETTKDPYLGLKAARAYAAGDGGVIDYLVSSSPTVRGALESLSRYARLVNDALEFRVETSGGRMVARIENRIPLPRAGADFQLGVMFRALSRVWTSGSVTGLVVSSEHPAPKSRGQYEKTFGPVKLEFSASFSGFSFDAGSAENELAGADARLHSTIRRHADALLERLPETGRIVDRVKDALQRELSSGDPSVTNVARRLHVSARTLERRLRREGTSYSSLLAELRNELAASYLATRDVALSEISARLGFSEQSAFQRAFKRWTGTTPLHFRRRRGHS